MGGKGDGGSNWIMKDMTSFMRPPLMSWVTGKESFYDSVRNSGGAAEQAINRWVMGEPNKTTFEQYGGGDPALGAFGQMTALTQSMQSAASKAAQEAADARFAASQAQLSAKEEEEMIGQDKAYFDRKKSLAEERLKQLQDLKKSTTSKQEPETKASSMGMPIASNGSTPLNTQKPLMNIDALPGAATFSEDQALNQLMPPSGSSVKFGGN